MLRSPSGGPPRPGRPLAVVVVDDQRLVAESLARMLSELDDVGSAGAVTSLDAARGVLGRGTTDVVLVDLEVHGESGLDLVERVPRQGRARPLVMIFSTVTDPHRVAGALLAGAAGWLVKDASVEQLVAALSAVQEGRHWVPPPLRADVIEALLTDRRAASSPDRPTLSPRQLEVLECLLEGLAHAEVAERLGLSTSTVRTHVRHMCRMFDVHSTPALLALARAEQVASSPARTARQGGDV